MVSEDAIGPDPYLVHADKFPSSNPTPAGTLAPLIHEHHFGSALVGSVESVPALSQAQFALQQAVEMWKNGTATSAGVTEFADDFLNWLKENEDA